MGRFCPAVRVDVGVAQPLLGDDVGWEKSRRSMAPKVGFDADAYFGRRVCVEGAEKALLRSLLRNEMKRRKKTGRHRPVGHQSRKEVRFLVGRPPGAAGRRHPRVVG